MEDGVVDTSYGEVYDTSADPGMENSQLQSIRWCAFHGRCLPLLIDVMHECYCSQGIIPTHGDGSAH